MDVRDVNTLLKVIRHQLREIDDLKARIKALEDALFVKSSKEGRLFGVGELGGVPHGEVCGCDVCFGQRYKKRGPTLDQVAAVRDRGQGFDDELARNGPVGTRCGLVYGWGRCEKPANHYGQCEPETEAGPTRPE